MRAKIGGAVLIDKGKVFVVAILCPMLIIVLCSLLARLPISLPNWLSVILPLWLLELPPYLFGGLSWGLSLGIGIAAIDTLNISVSRKVILLVMYVPFEIYILFWFGVIFVCFAFHDCP
ncbi:MAG: hypothetical protein HY938_09480 [Nitrosomonadales bacterium]|nr:hypothetical protein [Nitrosomonadales bacterium]